MVNVAGFQRGEILLDITAIRTIRDGLEWKF
jgi:hypothetical protein